jgi:hypothetical protein
MFEPPVEQDDACANDDVARLASRRLASETTSSSKSLSPNFTLNIAGLSDLVGGRSNTGVPVTSHTTTPSLPRKMTLPDWCTTYELSDTIRFKLEAIDITGPHCLRFISDEDLRTGANLSLGELADVRDGQERWKAADENK